MIALADKPRTPLPAWFHDEYRPLKRKLKKQASVDDVITTIEHFGEYLVERDAKKNLLRTVAYVEDLTDVNIGGYMAWKAERVKSSSTVNKHRRNLMALARIAKRKGYITEIPDVERESEHERTPECWSIEEMATIIAAASVEPGMVGEVPARLWWPAIIWMVFNTGFRISALMLIKSVDVDVVRGWLVVRAAQQKDKADQPMDLMPETIEALRVINFHHLEFLFGDWPYDKKQRQWKVLNKYLKRILQRAELSSGKLDMWHKFRRVFATNIAAASDISTAQRMCGHSSPNTTKRYIDPRYMPTTSRAANLLPRPQVARQLKLFTPPAEAS